MSVHPDEVLERIDAIFKRPVHEPNRRSLIHAYIACFNFADLANAISIKLNAPSELRLALRSRMLRHLREGVACHDFDVLTMLIETTAVTANNNKMLRQAVDALHSALFPHAPLHVQQMLLDRWHSRGTKSAMARWLKATRDQPFLFDVGIALSYWRWSKDSRTAKSLAYQASPEELRSIVPEFVQVGAEGWIIARAIVRAGWANELCWEIIHARHPATFLYLCAKMHRPVSDNEAFELVCRCRGTTEDNRGLAIWALGSLGKFAVLDRIYTDIDKLQRRDLPRSGSIS
jgi:hypothetical protein